MKTFAEVLTHKMKTTNSCVIVGLDPRLDNIPDELKKPLLAKGSPSAKRTSEIYFEFNRQIIDAIAGLVPAVKPQSAFYEALGPVGVKMFAKTCAYAKKKGLVVVADVKRGDVPSTAVAYSNAFIGESDCGGKTFEPFKADAMTVNPYLGGDSIQPYLDDAKKHGTGIFVLVKTSNKGSKDLQDLKTEQGMIYEVVARSVDAWGKDMVGKSGYSPVGAVVGATFPEESKTLRKLMPNSILLVPGYGAQGADAEMVRNCFDEHGLGALIVAARSIIFAHLKNTDYTGKATWQECVVKAVNLMNEELNKIRFK